MKLTPMEKTPSSPLSPSSSHPLPLILLTQDSANPHLISKHRKITATRSFERVDSCDSLHRSDIFPPILHEGLELNPFFPHEKGEKNVEKDVGVESETETEMEERSDNDVISLKYVYEYSRSLFREGYERVRKKIGGWCVISGWNGTERTVWSVASVAVLFGAFTYVRKRDRRERQLLMLLLEEKDQRIGNMLQQIALVNDIRSLTSRLSAVKKI